MLYGFEAQVQGQALMLLWGKMSLAFSWQLVSIYQGPTTGLFL